LGGGGKGGNGGQVTLPNGLPGLANTGGGGGGSGRGGLGGAGGSGIVVMRCATNLIPSIAYTGTMSTTTASGFTTYTFTSSGTLTT
jgi:hypothetical protein